MLGGHRPARLCAAHRPQRTRGSGRVGQRALVLGRRLALPHQKGGEEARRNRLQPSEADWFSPKNGKIFSRTYTTIAHHRRKGRLVAERGVEMGCITRHLRVRAGRQRQRASSASSIVFTFAISRVNVRRCMRGGLLSGTSSR